MIKHIIGLSIGQPLCFYSENVFKEISLPVNGVEFRELYLRDIYWDTIDNVIKCIKIPE